jgi:ABC-type microcin C transport system duplicated ATPase subunit YejF
MDQDITQAQGAGLRQLRERVQMVFQDPLASLNPRQASACGPAAPTCHRP